MASWQADASRVRRAAALRGKPWLICSDYSFQAYTERQGRGERPTRLQHTATPDRGFGSCIRKTAPSFSLCMFLSLSRLVSVPFPVVVCFRSLTSAGYAGTTLFAKTQPGELHSCTISA